MGSKRSPGMGDRHRQNSGAVPVATGGLGRDSRPSKPPPPLREGQHRCPVCRNGASLTPNGHLRQHSDLWGHRCYNRRPEAAEPPPAPQKDEWPYNGVLIPPPPTTRDGIDGGRLSPTGRCHECDRPVSGERRFCGACLARRHL